MSFIANEIALTLMPRRASDSSKLNLTDNKALAVGLDGDG